MHDDRLDIAERILKPHLKEDPFDVRAIRMLAELAARIGRLKDSEMLLRRAVEIAPGFTPARTNLAVGVGPSRPTSGSIGVARSHLRTGSGRSRPSKPESGDARQAGRLRAGA